MTLEEYEKVLEEKRRVLLALKTEERKVDKKAFESMLVLSNKKSNDDVFIKLVRLINLPGICYYRITWRIKFKLLVTCRGLKRTGARMPTRKIRPRRYSTGYHISVRDINI